MYDGTDSLAIDKVWAILHQRTRQPNRRITPAPSHGKRILRDVASRSATTAKNWKRTSISIFPFI
jgi:hypothetical protein